jgi:glycosyltransferase involved in cell wall biosynthesis
MGRLVYAKRFDRLVEAVAIVQEKLRANGWQVYLYGDGIIKNEIAEKIAGYKLEDIFFLKGRTATPYDVMAESSVFTITSEYEGFPNVLCEAMACGCVPVSVDFDFGPREMITHKVNGLLVGQNPKDVAQGLVWLIDHPAELEGMRQEAFKIYECLCVEKIASQWESVFEQISITP